MKTPRLSPFVLIFTAALVWPAWVQAASELSFMDTFTSSADSDDVNFENGLGRQTGSAGVFTYGENTSGATAALSRLAAGRLLLEATAAVNYTAATPGHNFIEGGTFTIEFDLDAGVNDGGNTSGDWACIVFGASSTVPVFVNASDGMGILFRNNGQIQVFDGGTAVFGGGTLPTGSFRVRIEVSTAQFGAGNAATVRMFVDGTQVQIGATTMEHVKAAGFTANYVTLGGSAFGGANWIHAFDNLTVSAVPCIRPSVSTLSSYPGQADQSVTITIPASLNAGGTVSVVVSSSNPSVAEPAGAVAGSRTLMFPPGTTTQAFTVVALQRGTAALSLSTPSGGCIEGGVVVTVGSALVKNPSFEENYNSAFPGYSPINQWNQIPGGNTGVNEAGGPFHDNGVIPDRARVALHQGNGGISQQINGLIPGQQYWLQFRYNRRQGGQMGLRTLFAGVELDSITAIPTANGSNPYHARQVVFTPAASSGLLEFRTAASGDATALIDAVTLVPRGTDQVLVRNPSFEASGFVPGEVIGPGALSGWTGTGTYGVAKSLAAGSRADNGTNPDQDAVAFVQGAASLSQTISNLVIGQEYQIIYSLNVASGGAPFLRVSMGADVLRDEFEAFAPVGGTAPYHRFTNTWLATVASAELRFASLDDTFTSPVLIDDVQFIGLALPPCETTVNVEQVELFANQPVGSGNVLVGLPLYLVATQSVDVVIISLDPPVAVPAGGAGGVVTLHFAAGGTNALNVGITGVGSGTTTFIVSNTTTCASTQFTVRNRTSLVLNPSFEDNSSSGVGYSEIASWLGGSGVNNSGQPFADNGVMPDRGQVAFLQGANSMSQVLRGLDPSKQYWIQLYANARNCCGDAPSGSVSFDGAELYSAPVIPPVGGMAPYYFVNIPFSPGVASGELRLASGATAANGDRTLLLDAVTVVQRDAGQLVVQNPSFEASGTVPFPGYIQPALLAGWTGAGNYGVNISGRGPFADNGVAPDQDSVAFLQGQNSSLSQTLTGLMPGGTYRLSYAYNARQFDDPGSAEIFVTIDGATAHQQSVDAVGGANPYHTTNLTFTAAGASAVVVFTQTATGDQTLLLDHVKLTIASAPVVLLSIAPAPLNSVRLAWPKSLGAAWTLQQVLSLPAAPADWMDAGLVVGEEGDDYVAYDNVGSGNKFYRLRRP